MRARFQCGADVLEDNGKVGSPGDASYVHNSNCENEKNVPALCSALIWTNDLEMRCTDTQELGKTQCTPPPSPLNTRNLASSLHSCSCSDRTHNMIHCMRLPVQSTPSSSLKAAQSPSMG